MVRVLQLANGYLGSQLYKNLFSAQRALNIRNIIYVPIRKDQAVPDKQSNNVTISPCFSQLDRVLFFRKQKRLLADLENRGLINVDVVHAHTVFSGGYAALQLHKKYGLPYIVAVRNTDVNIFFKWMVHLRKKGIDIIRHAERVVFLSPAYQEVIIQKYVPKAFRKEVAAKSEIIPNGISPLFLLQKGPARSLSGGPLRLIYVGEVNANKNLKLTIAAAKKLIESGMPLSLTVVGNITEKSCHQLIEQTDFLEYYPRCPLKDVLDHLRTADIFIMPSHTETFGLVYAEAMSQGLPVLYTRGQGFDGQFPEGTVGYAVSDTDPTELATKIKMVVKNYSALSENCIQLVGRFDWTLIAEKYYKIYQDISPERGTTIQKIQGT